MEPANTTAQLQNLLNSLKAGDDSARTSLIQRSLERFQELARKMFHRQPQLRAANDTDDVIQAALVRLHKSLAQITPGEVREFFGLAARQIRWVLLDMVRKMMGSRIEYTGGTVPGTGLDQLAPLAREGEPSSLLEWADFHEAIDRLPEDQREIFDLLFYKGLSQEEASRVLDVSVRTLKRRWQSARLQLQKALKGEWPSE